MRGGGGSLTRQHIKTEPKPALGCVRKRADGYHLQRTFGRNTLRLLKDNYSIPITRKTRPQQERSAITCQMQFAAAAVVHRKNAKVTIASNGAEHARIDSFVTPSASIPFPQKYRPTKRPSCAIVQRLSARSLKHHGSYSGTCVQLPHLPSFWDYFVVLT